MTLVFEHFQPEGASVSDPVLQDVIERDRLERLAWLDLQRAEKVPTVLARRIQREIVERDLEAGDMLGAEAVMLARFGVGRASLREALRILENHGIIRIKPGPGGGVFVASKPPQVRLGALDLWFNGAGVDPLDLFEARATLREMLQKFDDLLERPELTED